MVNDIFISLGYFFLYFIVNPLLYIGLYAVYLFSGKRVKEERNAFHTRVYGRMADITIPFLSATLMGICVSVVTMALGLTITLPFVAVLAVIYILFALTFQIRWMTPTFVLGFVLILYGIKPLLAQWEVVAPLYQILDQVPIVVVATLLVLLMLVEGVLIRINGATYTSPLLERSKRGKWVGIHRAKRLWMVPVVLFIPEGLIPTLSFWPIITIADTTLQPVLVPFLIGFFQKVRSTLPAFPIQTTGLRVIGLSCLFALLAVGSYFFPLLAIVLGVLAIVSRELLTIITKNRDRKSPAFFSTRARGCIVLGVLPGSPADKMNIAVGETIVKVNGKEVSGETSFYEALQINSAFCKMDVLNHEGEIRFAQGALYDGEHHQLGVLLIKDDMNLQDSII
ncbi:PDZ domain-containing protein [Halalkalibacter kiskunsagensis]|uniref:PDZ domain-containing protein n=1 Tax=Halalkalibacter kiskunsagensis TaxID=1548599 RepID=A0ABV6KA73_9BACI